MMRALRWLPADGGFAPKNAKMSRALCNLQACRPSMVAFKVREGGVHYRLTFDGIATRMRYARGCAPDARGGRP